MKIKRKLLLFVCLCYRSFANHPIARVVLNTVHYRSYLTPVVRGKLQKIIDFRFKSIGRLWYLIASVQFFTQYPVHIHIPSIYPVVFFGLFRFSSLFIFFCHCSREYNNNIVVVAVSKNPIANWASFVGHQLHSSHHYFPFIYQCQYIHVHNPIPPSIGWRSFSHIHSLLFYCFVVSIIEQLTWFLPWGSVCEYS